ncbi:MAG: helix-turn-helix transcriptional regulator [Alphaproteobacteria bacterium]|nr:helix-turn-helix transcriptional regulator [Alphaproteobacteria bacterium]MCW5744122.1 helix-turn-helix transcriptional regulator [Alphaproteobacteria bacterium]
MAVAIEEASALIGHIYDAAFDAALWPDVLIRLTDAMGGADATIAVDDRASGIVTMIAPRTDPASLRSYRAYWVDQNVVWQRRRRLPVGRVVTIRDLAPADFTRSPFHNEWWRPQGFGLGGMGVNLLAEGKASATCAIQSRAGRDAFGRKEAALFTLLAPHLVRAISVQRRWWHIELKEELALSQWERPSRGIVLVDARAHVVYANRFARAVLDARDGLFVGAGALSASDPEAASVLSRLIAGCANRGIRDGGPGGTLRVARAGRAPLGVVVVPFPSRERQADPRWLGLAWPTAIVIVTDPQRERRHQRDRLMRRFDLTPTEAELALEITRGKGREAAARRLNITLGTARTHLERIFSKAGVHRQAELVGLVSAIVRDAGPTAD